MSNFMKICPVEAGLFHANGLTDRHDEADSRFCNFKKATKQKIKIIPRTAHEFPEME